MWLVLRLDKHSASRDVPLSQGLHHETITTNCMSWSLSTPDNSVQRCPYSANNLLQRHVITRPGGLTSTGEKWPGTRLPGTCLTRRTASQMPIHLPFFVPTAAPRADLAYILILKRPLSVQSALARRTPCKETTGNEIPGELVSTRSIRVPSSASLFPLYYGTVLENVVSVTPTTCLHVVR